MNHFKMLSRMRIQQIRFFCKQLSPIQSPAITEVSSFELNDYDSFLKPTFNFAAYIDKSLTLQQFAKLGVDLSKLERDKKLTEFVLRLNFDRDVKNHIRFLHDNGVDVKDLGPFFTKNILILKEDLDDLQTRINYLESKRFNKESIGRIISMNPKVLSWQTVDVDRRLGYFQTEFALNGSEVRLVSTKCPKLITYNLDNIKLITFSLKEEMGFESDQLQKLMIKTPKIWTMSKHSLLGKFDYIHNIMGIPHEYMVHIPQVFYSREFRIKQRHLFLQKIHKAQYDPGKPNYISLKDLVTGDDLHFATEVAKSSLATFNLFLKTM